MLWANRGLDARAPLHLVRERRVHPQRRLGLRAPTHHPRRDPGHRRVRRHARSTTLPAPTFAPRPTSMFPRIFAPAPTMLMLVATVIGDPVRV